jgi:Raf kinase inhibitor-like YbhB/YbcL family protein
MEVESAAFTDGDFIPKKYTCQGEDLSPPLHFKDLPKGTKSLAIIVDDPDAPMGVFDHWIAWNIPANNELKEAFNAAKSGKNGFGNNGYRGPCPPRGETHRYFFKVYALDDFLDLPVGSSKKDLENALKPHVLGSAELIGKYKKDQ